MFNDLKINANQLPGTIPVFPLTGTVLMPGSELPLNIFEPKYVNMVEDSFAEKRLIGMIQPKQGIFSKIRKSKPLYNVGCLGRIKAFNETEDGRYLIVLGGICRFKIEDEIPTIRGYRRFKANYENYLEDFEVKKSRELFGNKLDRKELFNKVDNYIAKFSDEKGTISSFDGMDKMSDAIIVDFITSYMPFNPQEKQLFLECKDIEERTKALYKVLGIAEAEAKLMQRTTLQ